MPVVLDAIHTHEHFDRTGTTRVQHAPGDRYTLEDAPGMTATELAAVFVAAGLAALVRPDPPKTRRVR
jgi:hypothetical protein